MARQIRKCFGSNLFNRTVLLLLFVFGWGLTDAHAQSRLTPISGAIYWGKGDLTDYETELNSVFLPYNYRFAYIVRPSFRQEYCLVGLRDSLILKKAETKIWPVLESKKVSVKEYKLHISSSIFDSISDLFESATLSSSYLSAEEGCDGTTYDFISWYYTAECWSPREGSNCRKLVDLTDTICKAVEQHDSMLIKRNLNKISELHHTFKNLYNQKPSDENSLRPLNNPDGYNTHFRGYHFVTFLCITFIFFILVGIIGSIILLCSKKRRKNWWIPLLAAILICVVVWGIAYSFITINSIEL